MPELVEQLPARMRAPLRQVLSLTATSLWLAPLVAGVLAALLAVALLVTDPVGSVIPFALKDAQSSRDALTAILSATIAATSLVITGTIIALQLATGQYSPRLLRGVLTDRGVRWPLGALVGTVVHLRVRQRVGDFLVEGTTAAWAWSRDGSRPDLDRDDLTEQVDQALALGVDRTLEGDPSYGLRHLVDIGLRAVSTGVNDPTTAVQTIHHATRLLVHLASRPVTNGVAERDGCRVVLPRPDLAAHLELAQAQLVQYGGGDARVVEALAAQLRDVLEAGTRPDLHELVRDQFDALQAGAETHDHSPRDAELLRTALDRVERQLTDDAPDDEESSAG